MAAAVQPTLFDRFGALKRKLADLSAIHSLFMSVGEYHVLAVFPNERVQAAGSLDIIKAIMVKFECLEVNQERLAHLGNVDEVRSLLARATWFRQEHASYYVGACRQPVELATQALLARTLFNGAKWNADVPRSVTFRDLAQRTQATLQIVNTGTLIADIKNTTKAGLHTSSVI